MAFVYRCNGVEIISVMVTAVLHHASVFIPCVIIVQILFSYRSDMTRILVCDCRNRLYPILEKLGLCWNDWLWLNAQSAFSLRVMNQNGWNGFISQCRDWFFRREFFVWSGHFNIQPVSHFEVTGKKKSKITGLYRSAWKDQRLNCYYKEVIVRYTVFWFQRRWHCDWWHYPSHRKVLPRFFFYI